MMPAFERMGRVAATLLGAVSVQAFDVDVAESGPYRTAWRSGNIVMHVEMPTSPTFSDGTNPSVVVVEALQRWNTVLGQVQFVAEVIRVVARRQAEDGVGHEPARAVDAQRQPAGGGVAQVCAEEVDRFARQQSGRGHAAVGLFVQRDDGREVGRRQPAQRSAGALSCRC